METLSLNYFDIREFGLNSGPFAEDPSPRTGYARLYHGTSDAGASGIAARGFQPYDYKRLLTNTSTELGISEGELDELVSGTFLGLRQRDYIDGRPDDAAYFTDSPLKAASWAMWGSESEAYAQATKNAFQHPERWSTASEAFNWTVRQQQHVPTVVAVDVEWEAARALALTRLRSLDEWDSPPFHRVPEVRIPVPTSLVAVVSIREIEPVVRREEVEARFGLRFGKITEVIVEGGIPAPDDENFGDLRWWASSLLEASA